MIWIKGTLWETRSRPNFGNFLVPQEFLGNSLGICNEVLIRLILKCPQILGVGYLTELEPTLNSIVESKEKANNEDVTENG